MNQPLIGLVGPQGSGKTTVATELEDQFNYMILSFADPLKEMLCALLDCKIEELEQLKRDNTPIDSCCGKTARELMQTLGTEWGRNRVGKDFWVLQLEKDLHDFDAPIVIPDLRFQNEAEMIRRNNGIIVELRRPGCDWKLDHPSEMGHLIVADRALVNQRLGDLPDNCRALHAWAIQAAGENG